MDNTFFTIFGMITFPMMALAFITFISWKVSGYMVRPKSAEPVDLTGTITYDSKGNIKKVGDELRELTRKGRKGNEGNY